MGGWGWDEVRLTEERRRRENEPLRTAGVAHQPPRGRPPESPAGVPGTVGRRIVAPPQRAPQGDSASNRRYPRGVSARMPLPGLRRARTRASVRRPAPPLTRRGWRSIIGRRSRARRSRARRACAPLRIARRFDPEAGHQEEDTTPDEADLPAEEAPSRQGARLPRPDEDRRGPPRSGHSSRSGPQAAGSLTPAPGRPRGRLATLTRPADFAAIQARGPSRSPPLMTARFLRTGSGGVRFGLATGRALGGSVVRNRARRRLRETLRVMAPSFQPGWDVLIIARPALVDADHGALVEALERLLRRGGVLGGSADA